MLGMLELCVRVNSLRETNRTQIPQFLGWYIESMQGFKKYIVSSFLPRQYDLIKCINGKKKNSEGIYPNLQVITWGNLLQMKIELFFDRVALNGLILKGSLLAVKALCCSKSGMLSYR